MTRFLIAFVTLMALFALYMAGDVVLTRIGWGG